MPSNSGVDRRKHTRKSYGNVIKFTVNPRSTSETLIGVSINISDSGICLYTSDSLQVGESILIQEHLPVRYQKARVVWVKNYHREFYKVGLMFLE